MGSALSVLTCQMSASRFSSLTALCCAAPQSIIDDPLMRHSAILVFANKQDLVRALASHPVVASLCFKALVKSTQQRHVGCIPQSCDFIKNWTNRGC